MRALSWADAAGTELLRHSLTLPRSGGAGGFLGNEWKNLSVGSLVECFHGVLELGVDEFEFALIDPQFFDILLTPDQRLQRSKLLRENLQFGIGFGQHTAQKV